MGIEYALVDDEKKEYFDLGKLPWIDQTFGRQFDPKANNVRSQWEDVICTADLQGKEPPSVEELRRRFSLWCDLGDWAPRLHAFLSNHGKLRMANDSDDSIAEDLKCVGTRYKNDWFMP